jgi:micrococcal nuclease
VKAENVWPILIFIFFVITLFLSNGYLLKNNETTYEVPVSGKIISSRQTAKVLKVVDGDTIKALIQNKEDTVRLIGINAPETVDPQKSAQCFGKESSDKAKEILTGKTIILESDSSQKDRDEYGRLLRYVFLQDETNFNEFMIENGFAREYTFKNNDYKYQSEFIQAQQRARTQSKGLWGVCRD